MNGHASRVGKGRNARRPLPKPHETEEEAATRRFHDAQRMARFRAKRKKALEEAKGVEKAAQPEMSLIAELQRRNIAFEIANSTEFQAHLYVDHSPMIVQPSAELTKYSQLLAVIEELGRDVRLTYAGSKSSVERLKIGIVQARMLVKECLLETKIHSQ